MPLRTSIAVVLLALTTPVVSAYGPAFDQYPAQVDGQKSIAVDLSSHPRARTFRTVLREASRKGPNFAGHFSLAEWGCGTNCSEVAIIDARNGRVYFPPQLQGIGDFWGGPERSDTPRLEFRLNSALLAVAGRTTAHDRLGISFLHWTGERFDEVAFVSKDEWQEVESPVRRSNNELERAK